MFGTPYYHCNNFLFSNYNKQRNLFTEAVLVDRFSLSDLGSSIATSPLLQSAFAIPRQRRPSNTEFVLESNFELSPGFFFKPVPLVIA